MNKRWTHTLVASAITGCWLSAWADGTPDDKAKQMVDGMCNTCHPLSARIGTGYDEKGWHTFKGAETRINSVGAS